MRIKFLPPGRNSNQHSSVSYLYDKEEKSLEKNDGKVIVMTKNLDNLTSKEWCENTKENCRIRESLGKTRGHNLDWNKNVMQLVVSLHPDETIKMEGKMQEVLQNILDEFGISQVDNNVSSWLHKDKNHLHMHILFSKVNSFGDVWDDKNIGYRLDAFSRKMVANHDLKYEDKGFGNKKKTKMPYKDMLNQILLSEIKKSDNYSDYLNRISKRNITIEVDGETNSLIYHFKPGDKTYSFHENKLYKMFSYSSTTKINNDRHFNNTFQEQKQYIKRSISKVLNKNINGVKITTLKELTDVLKEEYNISVILNKSKTTDKITGISFQSNNQQIPIKIKGSQINFSLSRINYLLKQNSQISENITQPINTNNKINKANYTPIIRGPSRRKHDDIEGEEERRKKKRESKEQGRDI